MSALAWLLWLGLSVAVGFLSIWQYRRRETPVRGRMLLAVLRAGAVALVLLLLFDPELPAGDGAARGTQVLLDASLSMRLPADGANTRWQVAVAHARSRTGDRPVLLFGERARAMAAGALPDEAPGDGGTRLLPALQAAAEAGVRNVIVLTDGGIEDADEAARWVPRLGLGIELVRVGSDVTNASLVEASSPQWIEAGQLVPLDFAVAGSIADSARAVVRREGRVIARATVPAPSAGRVAAGRMELRLDAAPSDDGWIRLDVALENGDAVPDDDQRTVYVQVGAEPAGVALVSFRPDWEPRFLAPLLERSLGLPLRAYLRSATGRYVRLASGLDAGGVVDEADVRRAVERGQLVVLHGLGIDAPAWAREAARTAAHVLIFPADDATAADLPAQIGASVEGDYFLAPEVPPSPVAALLAGVELAGTRPLTGLRPVDMPAGAWTPLMATRGRQGALMPLVAAGEGGGRRWAIALGSGYWQWAFRGGAERQLYARLWSALAGWLAREGDIASLPPVRPARMAAPRGAPVPWVTPAVASDSIHVVVSDEGGGTVMDTVITVARGDTAFTTAPPPGHYSYRARAFSGYNVITGEGLLTVERYSPEFARSSVDVARLESGATTVRGAGSARSGTPLHASPYAYALIVLLLAAEWILRRRWGLR